MEGYQYSRGEMNYIVEDFSTAQAFGNNPDVGFGAFTNGTLAAPNVNPQTGGLVIPYTSVVDSNDNVYRTQFTSGSNGGAENQGIVRVIVRGRRLSVPPVLPPSLLPPPSTLL